MLVNIIIGVFMGLVGMNALGTVLQIGKPRKLITPQVAAGALVIYVAEFAGLLYLFSAVN